MKIQTSEEKLNYVKKYLDKLLSIARQATGKGRYNLALSALSAYCNIQYSINQVYTDAKAEELLLQISEKVVSVSDNYQGEKNTVLFYDGFGLDLRGWAASFARAISSLEYDFVYVAPLHAKGKIPHIKAEVESGKGRIEYIDMKQSYVEHINALNEIFNRYIPKAAFFYTTPNDVAGAAVFDAYKGKVKRIQIDLTDHAFWIGVNAIDILPEGRDLGVSNAIYHRGFSKDAITYMDGCPYINRDVSPEPLPFDIEHDEYVFSGGSLYKTLGDEQLYFYKIVDHILSEHDSIKFLYAGGGDDSELKKIIAKYPGRAFHIPERPDFIRLFENCDFFLNTYPMFGGLMMRYAAMVGKIPLTLKHGSDHEGLLKDQDKRGIEFDTYEETIREADKLISDEQYRSLKELGLKGSVTTEEEYARRIQMIIEQGETDQSFEHIKEIDTTEFRSEYLERLVPDEMLQDEIGRKKNLDLAFYFPELFVKRVLRRITK